MVQERRTILRTSCWFASNGIGTIIGLAIAYGLYQHDNYSLPAWKLVLLLLVY